MKEVADDLCWRQGVSKGRALTMVEELIYSRAVGIDSDNAGIRQWSEQPGHRAKLTELRLALRQKTGEVRKELRRES